MGGDQVEHAITYFVMWELFASPALAGFAVVSHWLPHLLFSVTFGGLADRFDCRRIIQVGLGLFVLASLGWAITIGLGILEPWMCVVLLSVHGLASAVWHPANQLMLYDLVGPEELPSAVRLMATGLQFGMLIGPAVGALLLFTVGPVLGLVINVLMYVPFLVFLLRVPFDGHTRGGRSSERFTLRDAFRVLRELPRYPTVLILVVLQGAVAALFGSTLLPFLPAFGVEFGLTDEGFAYGVLITAMALGAVVGGLGFELVRIRSSVRISIGAALLSAVAIVVFALSGSFAVAVAALLVAGAATIVSSSTSASLVQLEAPPDRRGRFIGVYGTTSLGLRLASGVIVGGAVGVLGVGWAFGATSALLAVIAAALLVLVLVRDARVRASRSARS